MCIRDRRRRALWAQPVERTDTQHGLDERLIDAADGRALRGTGEVDAAQGSTQPSHPDGVQSPDRGGEQVNQLARRQRRCLPMSLIHI